MIHRNLAAQADRLIRTTGLFGTVTVKDTMDLLPVPAGIAIRAMAAVTPGADASDPDAALEAISRHLKNLGDDTAPESPRGAWTVAACAAIKVCRGNVRQQAEHVARLADALYHDYAETEADERSDALIETVAELGSAVSVARAQPQNATEIFAGLCAAIRGVAAGY